jgi:thiol-disulfide isomerase/thioredoxin
MTLRSVLLVGVLAVVGAGGFFLFSTTTVSKSGITVGKLPRAQASCRDDDCRPLVRALALDGTELSEETLAGKIVLINYWATWCGPCVREIPALDAVYHRHQADGFVVLGVSTDDGMPDAQIQAFAARHGATFPILRPTADLQKRVPDVLPTSYLYDRQGRLQAKWQGGIREQVLEDEVGGLTANR